METNELRYFLAVAEQENIHGASKKIFISPASLSKAISKLEKELHVKLFKKEGRNIKLTDEGCLLQKRASELMNKHDSIKAELLHEQAEVHVKVTSHELYLSEFAPTLIKKIRKHYPNTRFEMSFGTEEENLQKLKNYETHLVISSQSPSNIFSSFKLASVNFLTCCSKNHPLAKTQGALSIHELLEYDFVSPINAILGDIKHSFSFDGWRDDKFPRKKSFKTDSLKSIEELVRSGLALAYLPDFFVKKNNFIPLKIQNCPYKCTQNIYFITYKEQELAWLKTLYKNSKAGF